MIQNKCFPKINELENIPMEEEESKYHYCYIKNLSRLLVQHSSYQLCKYDHKQKFCGRCFKLFWFGGLKGGS